MIKARYDLRKVICINSSCIGFSSNVAKPGYWIEYQQGREGGMRTQGRVLGRIAEVERGGPNVVGHLMVVRLLLGANSAYIDWVDPDLVTDCYEKPPAQLLAWITGDDWVKNKDDIARINAMAQHGTLSERYIANRDNPEQAYNARPEYAAQWILS